jgi:predicted AlkP superfamily pyrophosphatase or phosphodiesterase
MDLKGYGRTFPHRFGEAGNKLLYTQLLASPVGDQLLLDFSKTLISNERLGQDIVPDYLSISFSGVDAINHFFGPSSLENEEVVRQLDRTLADLIRFIDKTIGLKHTLIVLSADHGMADMPEYMSELGYAAGRLVPEEIVATANNVGQRLGIDEVVRFFYRPYIYLDDEKIVASKQDLLQVEQAIANALTDLDGIEVAVATSGLSAKIGNPLLEQVRNNHHLIRSGDIYVIQEPYWFLFDEGPIPSMHGSPWRYDTHVPIIFSGPGINAQHVHRPVHPVDVAPTIAALLGMAPPAASQGTSLQEIFD